MTRPVIFILLLLTLLTACNLSGIGEPRVSLPTAEPTVPSVIHGGNPPTPDSGETETVTGVAPGSATPGSTTTTVPATPQASATAPVDTPRFRNRCFST
jgi:hypothetical protein